MGNLKALLRPTRRRKGRRSDDEVQEGIPHSRQESSGPAAHPVQHLQSTIGNQAVMRLVNGAPPNHPTSAPPVPTSGMGNQAILRMIGNQAPADAPFVVGNKAVTAGQMRRQDDIDPPKSGTASVLFALTAGGTFYLSNPGVTPQESDGGGNSAALNGRAVIMAGEMRYQDGVLKSIGSPSGAIQLDMRPQLRIMTSLEKAGVDVSQVVMKKVEKLPVTADELVRSHERPQLSVFTLMERIAEAGTAAQAADYFKEAAALNPGVLREIPYLPQQLMDLVTAELGLMNNGIAKMSTLDPMGLGLLGLRITKSCDMLELAATIYGDRIDPKLLAELRRLKAALQKKPEPGEDSQFLGKLLAVGAAAAAVVANNSGGGDGEDASKPKQAAPPAQENMSYEKLAAAALAEASPLKMVTALDRLNSESKEQFVPAVSTAIKGQGKSMDALAVKLLETANAFMASEQHWASYRALFLLNLLIPGAVSADSLSMAKKKAGAGGW